MSINRDTTSQATTNRDTTSRTTGPLRIAKLVMAVALALFVFAPSAAHALDLPETAPATDSEGGGVGGGSDVTENPNAEDDTEDEKKRPGLIKRVLNELFPKLFPEGGSTTGGGDIVDPQPGMTPEELEEYCAGLRAIWPQAATKTEVTGNDDVEQLLMGELSTVCAGVGG